MTDGRVDCLVRCTGCALGDAAMRQSARIGLTGAIGLVVILLLVASVEAFAQAAPDYDVKTVRVSRVAGLGSGAGVGEFTFHASGKFAANDPVYASNLKSAVAKRRVPIPSSIAAGGMSLLRGGVYGLAFSAAIAGVGWAIDEISGQISNIETLPPPSNGDAIQCFPKSVFGLGAGRWCAAKADGVCQGLQNITASNGFVWSCVSRNTTTGFLCFIRDGLNACQEITQTFYTPNFVQAANDTTFPSDVLEPAPDDDVAQLAYDTGLGEEAVEEALRDGQTWPELEAAKSAIETALEVPGSNPTEESSIFHGDVASELNPAPDVVSSSSGEGGEGAVELPAFCEWSPELCGLVDYITEDPPPDEDVGDSPVVDILDGGSSYSSGLGTGSCPADDSFAVLGASVSFSYTPMCDMASAGKPIVLAAAALSAAFIVAGAGRKAA